MDEEDVEDIDTASSKVEKSGVVVGVHDVIENECRRRHVVESGFSHSNINGGMVMLPAIRGIEGDEPANSFRTKKGLDARCIDDDSA